MSITPSIRISLFTLGSLFMVTSSLTADPLKLSDAEKSALLEKLEKVKETANSSSNKRFRTALDAFKTAAKSDSAAYSLFLKCSEKVNFEEENKGSQSFREWKRNHQEKKDTKGFRRALRHQLNWLLLSIEASAKPDEVQKLGIKATEKVDAVFEDNELLSDYTKILKQNVLNTVFAKAYNIDGLEAEKWPLNPLALDKIYSDVVLPPIRDSKNSKRLRGAWMKRIEQEGMVRKTLSEGAKGSKKSERNDPEAPEYIRWKEDDYLMLLWSKEVDCFTMGDEKQAADNMFEHIKENLSHKRSLEWLKQFNKLLEEEDEKAENSE